MSDKRDEIPEGCTGPFADDRTCPVHSRYNQPAPPSVQPTEQDGAVSEIERMWSLGEWTEEDNESFMRAIEIIRKHCPVVKMTPEEQDKQMNAQDFYEISSYVFDVDWLKCMDFAEAYAAHCQQANEERIASLREEGQKWMLAAQVATARVERLEKALRRLMRAHPCSTSLEQTDAVIAAREALEKG